MVTIDEEYPEEVSKVENKEILQKDITPFFIDFIKKQLRDIKEGKMEDMDIGDVFPLYAMAANKGYKFEKEMEEFIIKLGDYKLELHGKYATELNSIGDVEKEFNEVLKGLD